MIAVVDSGPLYAAVDADDAHHVRSLEVFRRADLQFVIPALVVAEVTYMVGRRMGAATEAAFLRSLAEVEVEAPFPEEWSAISSVVERYADFPLGGTDASVAVLAERLNTDVIVTLDHRHFQVLRTRRGRPFTLIPD